MQVFAYCTLLAREAVEAATGVEPLTSPPYTTGTFLTTRLMGHDLLYFRLHIAPHFPLTWFGEGLGGKLIAALDKHHLEDVDLGGATVVVANCYGIGHPLVEMLHGAGAGAVVAGAGPNLAAAKRVVGVDLLVKWLIWGLRHGMKLERAMWLARARLAMTAWRAARRDARKLKTLAGK